jgi:hypothetical protein
MTWKYQQLDTGLGTAYERVAIYQLFDRWFGGRAVQTALEGPIDGMSGISGLHGLGLAKAGTKVCVELTDPKALEWTRAVYQHLGLEKQLQLVLSPEQTMLTAQAEAVISYNALPLLDTWQDYLAQLAGRSTRYLGVVVLSPFSYGVQLHRLQRKLRGGGKTEWYDHPSTRPEILRAELEKHGRVVAYDFLDCPWWPETMGASLGGLIGAVKARVPGLGGGAPAAGPATPTGRHVYGAEKFPYFADHLEHPALAAVLRKHPVFDRFPSNTLHKAFGHLHGFLVERVK